MKRALSLAFDESYDENTIRHRRPRWIREREEHFDTLDDKDFVTRFRLTKHTVLDLLESIENKLEFPTNINNSVTPINQLLCALRFYATGCYQMTAADLCGFSTSTAHRFVHKVSAAIATLRPRHIYFPELPEEIRQTEVEFYKRAKFPHVVGAIDCTHVKFIKSPGDPTAFGNLKPSENIIDAICDTVKLNSSRNYGPTIGHQDARQAVAEYSLHQGQVTADDVILCSGCSHAIDIALSVIADAGQNVLIPRPGYLIHKTLGEGLGIIIKYYDLLPDKNWQVDIKSLENQIDEKTAAIVVNNPSNPCGSVYDKEHLKEIIEVASRNRVPIIADEIYEHFVFSDHEFTALSALSEDVPVLTCSGVTKRFLIPGWRLGWIIIHDRQNILRQEIRKGLLSMSTRILGPNTLIQKALPRILTETPQSFFDETVSFIESQAKLAFKELQKIPGLRPIMPQGSMYMMVEIYTSAFPKIEDELQFITLLCNEQSVLCIPGACFNYPNYVRIVLTVPEETLREACQRIAIFCEAHMSTEHTLKIEKDVVSIVYDEPKHASSKQMRLKNIA